MKSFSSILLSVLLIVCIYQLYQVLKDFFSGDKWTNTIKPISVRELEFPAVALCNFNRVNKSKLVEYGIDEVTMSRYVGNLGMMSLAGRLLRILDEMTLLDHLVATLYESFWNNYAVTTEMVGQLDPMLANMTLGRALYSEYLKEHTQFKTQADVLAAISIDCNAGYVCFFGNIYFPCCQGSHNIYTSHGSCFTIKPPNTPSRDRPYQASPGIRGGLQIHLTTSPEYYVSTLVNMWIQERYSMLVGYDTNNIAMTVVPLPVGFNSQVQLKRVVESTTTNRGVKLFQRPCSHMIQTKFLNTSYSLQSCIMECFAVHAYKTCGCITLEFAGGISTLKTCGPDDIHECINPKIKLAWENMAPDKFAKLYDTFSTCRMLCKPPCSRNDIEATSSLAVVPTPQIVSKFASLIKKISRNLSEEHFRKGFILLDVYFNDLTYTQIANYPRITLEQLLGNIGGVLGLWIGASMFTLIQLVNACFNEYRQRKRITSKKSIAEKTTNPAILLC